MIAYFLPQELERLVFGETSDDFVVPSKLALLSTARIAILSIRRTSAQSVRIAEQH